MLLPALTLTFHHRKTQTLRTQADALGLQTGRPGRGHRPQVQPTRLQAGIQRLTLCVIHIHHGSLQAGPCKQRGLGRPVGGHVTVVIQMVLGEIGENRRLDLGAVQPALGQTNRRSLDGTHRGAAIHQPTELLL